MQTLKKTMYWMLVLWSFSWQNVRAMQTTHLQIGMYQLTVEVAETTFEQEQGLMFRTHLPEYQGMLFIFPRPYKICMWMKNTLLPLSVAFIDDDGSIINIENMQPYTEESHCALKSVRYALEVNQNWFTKRYIQAGYKIANFPPNLKF